QLVQISHRFRGRIFDGYLLTKGKNRQPRSTPPRHANQTNHVLQQTLVVPRSLGRHQNAGQAMMGGGYDAPFGSAAGWQDMEAILFQFSCNFTNPLTGDRIGFDVAMNDQDGEFQVLVHEGFPEDASPQGRSFAFSHQARFFSARVKRVSSRSPVQAEATEAAHLRP